jgi:phenylalanyl-tRNA synthetase alpha chain
MHSEIEAIIKSFATDLAAAHDMDALQEVRNTYIGRKQGKLTALFEDFKKMSVEDKRTYGPLLNAAKFEVESQLAAAEARFAPRALYADMSVAAIKPMVGSLHPISQLQRQIEEVFSGLGFDIELAPEIDSEFYNFDSLNMPDTHPARDSQDTFYLDLETPEEIRRRDGERMLLRTQISNMQVRYMQNHKPPFAIIVPGRVYRNEALDASHEHSYQYMEGIVVGPNITFAQMAWTLDYAMKGIFGQHVKTKLLPSYFPFVEPGAELAISCLVCGGVGCPVCKQTGWVEILGCGMIHKHVFKSAGYPDGEYQGFAFGFGISRLTLMKYAIPDIRYFAENDLRFLNQF